MPKLFDFKNKLEIYSCFAGGNDPDLSVIEAHQTADPYALVATSGLRALWLISRLSAEHTHIPTLYIVDNSLYVKMFWMNMKSLFLEQGLTRETLKEKLDSLYQRYHSDPRYNPVCFEYCIKTSDYANEPRNSREYQQLTNPFYYTRPEYTLGKTLSEWLVNDVIRTEEELEFMKKVVHNTVIVCKNWSDTAAFQEIKRLCERDGQVIYAYPSNIIEYVNAWVDPSGRLARKIERNIERLAPRVCLHTYTEKSDHPSPDPDQVRLVPASSL